LAVKPDCKAFLRLVAYTTLAALGIAWIIVHHALKPKNEDIGCYDVSETEDTEEADAAPEKQ